MHRMRYLVAKAGLTLALTSFGLSGVATADLLKPNAAQSFPDLSGDIVGTQNYTYNASTGTGTFVVNNSPSILALGPQASSEYYVNDITGGAARSQSIDLTLNSSGQLVTGGSNTYTLYGSVTVDGHNYSGLLLSGTPDQFGYLPQTPGMGAMSVYDMHMNITGGLLQQIYGPDAYVRIIAETNSTFANSFTSNFLGLKAMTNVRAYNSPYPAAVPEPSAFAVLLACGGFGLFYRRRNRLAADDLYGEED